MGFWEMLLFQPSMPVPAVFACALGNMYIRALLPGAAIALKNGNKNIVCHQDDAGKGLSKFLLNLFANF
jgi:hypothetical protein